MVTCYVLHGLLLVFLDDYEESLLVEGWEAWVGQVAVFVYVVVLGPLVVERGLEPGVYGSLEEGRDQVSLCSTLDVLQAEAEAALLH